MSEKGKGKGNKKQERESTLALEEEQKLAKGAFAVCEKSAAKVIQEKAEKSENTIPVVGKFYIKIRIFFKNYEFFL